MTKINTKKKILPEIISIKLHFTRMNTANMDRMTTILQQNTRIIYIKINKNCRRYKTREKSCYKIWQLTVYSIQIDRINGQFTLWNHESFWRGNIFYPRNRGQPRKSNNYVFNKRIFLWINPLKQFHQNMLKKSIYKLKNIIIIIMLIPDMKRKDSHAILNMVHYWTHRNHVEMFHIKCRRRL